MPDYFGKFHLNKKYKFLFAPSLILAFIIFVAFLLTVFQTQNSQDIRQKAAEPTIENPIGQALYYQFQSWNPPAIDYLTVTDSDGLYSYNIDKSYTIEVWTKFDNVVMDSEVIIGNFANPIAADQWNFILGAQRVFPGDAPNKPKPEIYVRTGSGVIIARSPDYVEDDGQTWYHLAATITDKEVKLYVNGILKDTQYLSSPVVKYQNSILAIGSFLNSDNNYTQFFGAIDDLRISSAVRDINSNWVNGIYQKQLSVDSVTTGLWRFDGNTTDISILSRDAQGHGLLKYTSGKVPVISGSANHSPKDSRVFVTSSNFNANLGGLSGADNICQTLADNAGLGGYWMAWLSDSTSSAKQRLFHSSSGYYRLDGKKLANDWADLTDGALENSITLNERGDIKNPAYGASAWSNTNIDGSQFSNYRQQTCMDWSSGSYTTGNANTGKINNRDMQWTVNGGEPCSVINTTGLYCIEQVNMVDSRPPTPTTTPTLQPNPGKSVYFDYTGANPAPKRWISVSNNNNALAIGNEFTIEAWVRQTSPNGDLPTIFASTFAPYSFQSSNLILALNRDSNSNLANNSWPILMVNTTSTPLILEYKVPHRNDGSTWYHLAVTKSGNQYKLFVDGVLRKSGTASGNIAGLPNTEYLIGSYNGQASFYGSIDDIRVSNIARDIATEWQKGTYLDYLRSDVNTVGLWRMDGNLFDSSGNSYHGRAYGDIKYSDGKVPGAMPVASPTVAPTTIPTLLPTSTPTILPTATPTTQASPTPTKKPTPTPTKISTPTPTQVLPRVLNYSFEQDLDKNFIPDRWVGARLMATDKLDTKYVQQGKYSFLFTPQLSENTSRKTLTQAVNFNGLTGQTIALDVMHHAEKVSGTIGSAGSILQLVYTDGTTSQVLTKFPKTAHNWLKTTSTIKALKPYRKINITLFNNNIYTNYRMDNIALKLIN